MQKRFLALVLLLALLLPAQALAAPGQAEKTLDPAPELSLLTKELGRVITFRHVFGSTDEYFDLPALHTIQSAQVTLSFTVTQVAYAETSTLTLSLGGTPFYSTHVEAKEGERQTLTVPLPKELLTRGSNYLTIQGYVRMAPEWPCVDEVSSAGWLNIFDDSVISARYRMDATTRRLDEFPYPFAPSNPRDVVVAVSSAAQSAELEAALRVIARLARAGTEAKLISIDNISLNKEAHLIYTGLAANLPAELAEVLGKNPAQGAVVLLRDGSPYGGGELLLLAGDTPEALLRGTLVLEDETLMRQASLSRLELHQNQPLTPAAEALQSDLLTLPALGYEEGISLSGPFRQEANLYVSIARNRRAGASSKLTLHMRYADNLDFTRSLVTVYVDDIPIGSKKLTAENALDDTLELYIPADIQLPASFALRIAFDLEVPDLWCTKRPFDMPWAYVIPDSSLYLPTTTRSDLFMSQYPAPFVADGGWNRTLFVLPDEVQAADLAGLGAIAGRMGISASNAAGDVRVMRAGEFTQADYDYNLVLLGEPWRNGLIGQINAEHLFFKFEGEYQIASNEKITLLPNAASNMATIQLLRSPWNSARAALVVTATRSEHMPLAYEHLSVEKKTWALTGDGILIDGEEKVYDYQFKSPDIQRPEFGGQALTGAPLEGMYLLLGGGILIIALFVVLMLWQRSNRKRNKRKKGGQ